MYTIDWFISVVKIFLDSLSYTKFTYANYFIQFTIGLVIKKMVAAKYSACKGIE